MTPKRDKGLFGSLLQRESHPCDLLARTRRQVESVSHVAPRSHSHRRIFKKPRARLASALPNIVWFCLVITQWHLLLWQPGDRQRSEVMPCCLKRLPFKFPSN